MIIIFGYTNISLSCTVKSVASRQSTDKVNATFEGRCLLNTIQHTVTVSIWDHRIMAFKGDGC